MWFSMKSRLLMLTITFMFSLTLISCVYAGDVNETVIVSDQSFVESDVVCEDEIVDAPLSSPDNGISHEDENPLGEIVIDNNQTTSFEIVNNVEYKSEEFDFVSENNETPDNECFFNESQFRDMNFESDDELILDATFNNHILNSSLFKLNISLDGVACFEFFLIKMEDFDSSLLEGRKFDNSFEIKRELMIYILQDNNFENYLDSNIIICSNKATDNFAYSINNMIIGEESAIYCIFNSYYQNYLFFINKFLFFSVSIFSYSCFI